MATPNDLLILLDGSYLPRPWEWEQSLEWQAAEFEPNYILSMRSIFRHAAALFLKRLETPAADFLAFKEAAMILDRFELFQTEEDKNGSPTEFLGVVISDIFPAIRSRERALLSRKTDLARYDEYPNPAVIPEDKIGLDGFS